MKRFFSVAIGLLLLSVPAAAQQITPAATNLESTAPYRVGEKLTYNVSFASFSNAAHVELLVADQGQFFGRDGVALRAHVETTEIISATLFSINNDYTAYVNPENGQPYRVQQVVRSPGGPPADSPLTDGAASNEFPADFDFLSALYRFRAMPLADKGVYALTVRDGAASYRVQLRVLGRVVSKSSLGSFRVISTELVPENKDAAAYRPRIYFTDDERHLPVLIKLRRNAGDITAELVGSEFIKRPKSSGGAATVADNADDSDDKPARPPQTVNTSLPRGNNAALGTLPFQLGEKLNYNVYLTRVKEPVGTVTYEVRERTKNINKDALLLSVKAESTAALRPLFSVKDEITTYVDPFTLLPQRTEMNLQEGRRKVIQQLNWDQDRGLIAILNGPRVEVPLGAHDYLSFFYALRSFNLAPPPLNVAKDKAKKTAVVLLVENRPRIFSLESLRNEVIELDGQKVEATQIKLTTDDPANPDRYVLRLWVSNDSRRLPLRLTATLPQGVVRADLIVKPAN